VVTNYCLSRSEKDTQYNYGELAKSIPAGSYQDPSPHQVHRSRKELVEDHVEDLCAVDAVDSHPADAVLLEAVASVDVEAAAASVRAEVLLVEAVGAFPLAAVALLVEVASAAVAEAVIRALLLSMQGFPLAFVVFTDDHEQSGYDIGVSGWVLYLVPNTLWWILKR